ncbi:MAG TPA: MFS transporter [Thermoanaerobaculia bacterium]|nr:MFS transporter [Thermoanaerobaculia bacterium]
MSVVEADLPRSYWRLLRENRDFRLLYLASLISLGGDWFLTVALLDLVLAIAGSATLASLIIVLQSLPIFFAAPFAGYAIDRFDRRKLMIAVDIMRCIAALLPLLARSPALLVFAYVGVVFISIGAAYFDPAAQAALPNLVEPRDLAHANVLIGSAWGTMLMVGAGIGGIVTMQLGRDAAFVIDASTFLLSALLIVRIRSPFSQSRSEEHRTPPLFESIRETIRYARDDSRLFALLISKGGYGIGAGVVAMLSIFGREVFHRGAFGIGILFAARGVGALIGPFIARGVSRTDDQLYRLIPYSIFLFGLGYVALAFAPSFWFGVIAVLIAHLGGGAQWLTSTYGLQKESPDWIRGRVLSADFGFVTLTMSLSAIGSGIAADRFGAVAATTATASICLAWAIWWGVATRHLWHGRDPRG